MATATVDHCTAWIEGWWAEACRRHDIAYAGDGSRWEADLALLVDVAASVPAWAGDHPVLAAGAAVASGAMGVVMWTGVRLFGGIVRRLGRRRQPSAPTASATRPAIERGFSLPASKETTMNRKVFYDAVRPSLGALSQAAVAGFELVLDEAHRRGTRIHDLAYILATAWWESARTMQPVREAFWLSEAWRRKNLRYYPFYGRGLVQLTWEANYKKAGERYGVDFVRAPDLVMEPKHSVAILFDGMEQGWFTGRDLDDSIDAADESDAEDLREYKAARRVVNGTDKALEIGKLALTFEAGLKAADYGRSAVAIPALPSPPAVVIVEPAPIGHNGGPLIDPTPAPPPRPKATVPANPSPTPVEQASKAVGAGTWGGLAAAIWQAVVLAGVLPPPYDTTEFSTAIMGLIATAAAVIGAYRAPRNAEPA